VTARREFPDGYPPLAACRSCGRDFSGDSLFDAHRAGVHDYTLLEGLRREPPLEDGRRCLDTDEMRERGWRPLTDEEMAASGRHRHRAGFGVELWHDPAAAERTRRAFAGRRQVAKSGRPERGEAQEALPVGEESPAA
jgi:hypothetical protein